MPYHPRYDFLEDTFEGSGNRVDSKWIITRAIDRIHAICAYGATEKQSVIGELPRRISLGVTMLECIVSPVVDDQYRNEMKDFMDNLETKRQEANKKGLNFDPELEHGLYRFGALIRLIDRHNLLFERYVKDFVGVRKDQPDTNEVEEITEIMVESNSSTGV